MYVRHYKMFINSIKLNFIYRKFKYRRLVFWFYMSMVHLDSVIIDSSNGQIVLETFIC